jgi:hypothetical protein
MLIKLSTFSRLDIRIKDEVTIRGSISIERKENFKYLGTNLTEQNSIPEETKNS